MEVVRISRLGCFTYAMLLASSPVFAQTVDRGEVEKIVREYILQNPEIIEEALGELEKRTQAAQAQARLQTIQAEADTLLRSGNDVLLGNLDALSVSRLKGNSVAADFHVRLMDMQRQINRDRALGLAEEMGLDRKQLSEEMAKPAVESIISANIALAQRLGLTGTPSFIAGEQIIEGAVGKKPLADAIETARQKGPFEAGAPPVGYDQ